MRDSYHKPFRLLGEGYCYRLVLSHYRLHPDRSCTGTLFHDSAPCCVTSFYLTPCSPFHLASGFSGQRRARATSASLYHPSLSLGLSSLFLLFGSSLWSASSLSLSVSFLLSCLDSLTKDCQGFLLLLSRSLPLFSLYSFTALCAASVVLSFLVSCVWGVFDPCVSC